MKDLKMDRIIGNAEVLWNFHCMRKLPSGSVDFVLGLGSHDLRVAEYAASVALDRNVGVLAFTGGAGKVTGDLWKQSEADAFASVAQEAGVPDSIIVKESNSRNTTDNFVNTRRIFEERGLIVANGLIVTKPYMMRRAMAVALKQWPVVEWFVDSPRFSFSDYPNTDVPLARMINLMVGDLQRLKVYADRGFQVAQEIPDDVWAAYDALVAAGYDDFVIA